MTNIDKPIILLIDEPRYGVRVSISYDKEFILKYIPSLTLGEVREIRLYNLGIDTTENYLVFINALKADPNVYLQDGDYVGVNSLAGLAIYLFNSYDSELPGCLIFQRDMEILQLKQKLFEG